MKKRRKKSKIRIITVSAAIVLILVLGVYIACEKGVIFGGEGKTEIQQNEEVCENSDNNSSVEYQTESDDSSEYDGEAYKVVGRNPANVVSYKDDGIDIYSGEQMYTTYYVNPDDVKITFPAKKKNVVYIFIESLEKTLETKENGGAADHEIMPYFEELQNDPRNVFVANEDGYQGYQCTGGENTIRGTVSQTTGTPLTDDVNQYNYPANYRFVPGTKSIGNILEENGYKNIYISGFDTVFAATDRYLAEHGNYQVIDTNSVEKYGYSMKGYEIEWGFSDRLAINILEDQILKNQESGQPFSIITATLDTHSDDVFIGDKSSDTLTDPHEIAFNGADSLIKEFLEWFKTQPSYEDTTIVITGDHLSHAYSYYDQYEYGYDRTVYSVFINASVDRSANYVKTYSTLDMFPSTLAAMGVEIEGNRLGLGVNLFSTEMPLASKFGVRKFNALLNEYSSYFEKNIMLR